MMHPSHVVMEAFGARGRAEKMTGGRGTAWHAGDLVLKPLDMPVEALGWLDDTARPLLATSGLRVSLPVRSRSGELLVDDWSAFPFVRGSHPVDRWHDVADVGRRFAAALADEPRPAFIAHRTDAWARADRFAWGEAEAPVANAAPFVAALVAARQHVDAPSGIVHADLAGNVLFDDTAPPAVIDPSLFWRPAEYSVAIVAVDAVCFHGAPISLFDTIGGDAGFQQHLIRALLFRIVTDALNGRDIYASYRAAVDRVLASEAS
jgi:uncharacterized protein (TIGR02569 family)